MCVGVVGRRGICEAFLEIGAFCAKGIFIGLEV